MNTTADIGMEVSNLTNVTVDYRLIELRKFNWIISEVFDLFFIVTTIWLSINMLVYIYKTGKWRLGKRDFAGGQVLIVAACVGPATLPRYILTQAVLFIGYNPSPLEDHYCEYVEDASILLFGVSLIPTYLYLWLRQRAFYLQPSLAELYTTLVKVLNWGAIIFMLISLVCAAALFVSPTAYMSSPTGCVLRPNLQEDVVPYYVTVTTLLTSQSILVGLFIYPLFVHRKVQVNRLQAKVSVEPSSSVNPDSSTKTVETQLSTSSNHDVMDKRISTGENMPPRKSVPKKATQKVGHRDRVLRAIQRSVVCAVCCILSDLAAFFTLTFILPRDTPKGITNVVYDFSLWMNLLSVIFSFETYKNILLPC